MIFLFRSVNVVDYINGFPHIELTLNTFNPIWSWYIIFALWYWILFIKIFNTFVLIFISDTDL